MMMAMPAPLEDCERAYLFGGDTPKIEDDAEDGGDLLDNDEDEEDEEDDAMTHHPLGWCRRGMPAFRARLSSANRLALRTASMAVARRVGAYKSRCWLFDLPYTPANLALLQHKLCVAWALEGLYPKPPASVRDRLEEEARLLLLMDVHNALPIHNDNNKGATTGRKGGGPCYYYHMAHTRVMAPAFLGLQQAIDRGHFALPPGACVCVCAFFKGGAVVRFRIARTLGK